jgi:hypothetical protein
MSRCLQACSHVVGIIVSEGRRDRRHDRDESRLGSLTAAGIASLFVMMQSWAEGATSHLPRTLAQCRVGRLISQSRPGHGLVLDVGCGDMHWRALFPDVSHVGLDIRRWPPPHVQADAASFP